MRATWRLITCQALDGALNMSIDDALMEAAGARSTPPVLRLYRWSPPCLSLGYAQPVADVDPVALRRLGWDMVRRPTGGRAILHTDELTYAVIAPADEPRVAGSVLESYRRLSQALLAALHLLEIPAVADTEYPQAAGIAANGPVCFERPSNYEITVNGKKLIGSAQSRRLDAVLQHGSLPLTGDLARITQALAFADEPARQQAAERLLQRALTVESAVGRAISWEDAAQAFARAFAETFDIELCPDALSAAEIARAGELRREKYAHPSWTERI